MDVQSFAEIEEEFIARVHTVVWCNVATVDQQGRPRSRVLHPIWEGTTGWIGTYRDSFKAQHLAHNPHVSLAYVGDVAKPVYAECVATWADDPAQKQHVWDLFAQAPHPLGYDPTPLFVIPDHARFGVLKLTPWRIELVQFPAEPRVWRAPTKNV